MNSFTFNDLFVFKTPGNQILIQTGIKFKIRSISHMQWIKFKVGKIMGRHPPYREDGILSDINVMNHEIIHLAPYVA